MAFITWNEEYSVKVAAMDTQHQRLIEIINQLLEAVLQGKGRDAMGAVLDELVDYTKVHFSEEEELLQRYAYPKYQDQSQAHGSFIQKVSEMQDKYHGGQLVLARDVLNFLRDWLLNHIVANDKPYGAYLNEKGVF